MPREEWGVKRVCPKTGKRFYDLNRTPVISPYTGLIVELETGNKARLAPADMKGTKPEDDLVTDDEDLEDGATDVNMDDDLLEEDDDDNVSLEEIADVAGDNGDDES